MNILKKALQISPLVLALSSITTPAFSQQEFVAPYFSQVSFGGDIREIGVPSAVLNDTDLIRGNSSDEAIFLISENTSPLRIFNGTLVFDTVNFRVIVEDGESLITVDFKDGSKLDDVLSIRQSSTQFGITRSRFLIDQNALASIGKNLNDIARVSAIQSFDHDLNYSDFGFIPGNVLPVNETETTEIEVDDLGFNTILGTNGRDRLEGSNGADRINGKGGSRDVLTGNGGEDLFIFGAEVNNGSRNRDVITDFDIDSDSLVIENRASIVSVRNRRNSTVIRLNGRDRDTIVLRGVIADQSSINIIYENGSSQ